MSNEDKLLNKEIALICLHYPNVTWSDAWNMSYLDRITVTKELKSHNDRQAEAAGKGKTIRATDLD